MNKKDMFTASGCRVMPELMALDLMASDPFWKNRGFSKKVRGRLKEVVALMSEVVKEIELEVENMELENE